MKTIGIIGGKGLMGNFFANFFRKNGFQVAISDINTKLSNKKLVQLVDIVMISVPIHKTKKVIHEIVPFTKKNQLLLDVTSLKEFPIREMLKGKSGVIGLHPMFRPSELGIKNQTVVMCIGRAKPKTISIVKGWFEKNGATVVNMSASQHDKLMSIIQVLLHFHTIALGNTMRSLGVPIRNTLQVASPIYRLEMDMIGRIFSQNPLLYGPIEMFNPKTKRVVLALEKEIKKLSRVILSKDLKKFAALFRKTSTFLGSFKEEALEEINRLLKHLKSTH